ncbi:MAG: universal stress protein [Oleiphilaceae bacterium]|nr:universal stress protein [Oleiphilaceae bacterium]
MAKVTQSIVVACDGSEQSLKAAKMAASLAKATAQPLKMLAVFPASEIEKMAVTRVWSGDVEEEVNEFRRKVFSAAREAVSGTAEPTDEILLKGDPAHQIVDYLKANPGTHLVLGRRGHSALTSLTLGSVSEKVVRHATGPVTVVSD